MAYARETKVPVDRSRAELEKVLKRYGATRFAYAEEPTQATIAFELADRRVRVRVPFPSWDDEAIKYTDQGYERSDSSRERALDQLTRSRWRAVVLVIKAKLESVEAGIETFDEAFLAWLLVPGTGRTVGEDVVPRLVRSYETGETPPLLPKL